MESRVKKWGNSLGIRIPSSLAKEIDIDEDELVELSVERGNLIMRKSQRYELNDLLAQIDPENLHHETKTGQAVGKEEW
ncbi:MAG: AbrB/MazE/SpoVT family DNA-binding domain-containing protein [Candidatus Obscuribacterales bacterium]|nr:AbrB/MazE/SpoVT family DNA-binding domain-containing protein [Candidatus Obscuribacterales bacterium]